MTGDKPTDAARRFHDEIVAMNALDPEWPMWDEQVVVDVCDACKSRKLVKRVSVFGPPQWDKLAAGLGHERVEAADVLLCRPCQDGIQGASQ